MRFPIRPGKVTCAGVVVIMMVLPNSIWKGADANATPRPKIEKKDLFKKADSPRLRVKFREVSR